MRSSLLTCSFRKNFLSIHCIKFHLHFKDENHALCTKNVYLFNCQRIIGSKPAELCLGELSADTAWRKIFLPGKMLANRQTKGPVQCLTCVVPAWLPGTVPCFSNTAVALILLLYFTSFGFSMLLWLLSSLDGVRIDLLLRPVASRKWS